MGDRGQTGRDESRGRGGPRPRGAGPSGRPRGVRRPGAPGQRLALRGRVPDPPRHGARRGRSAERPRPGLAPASAPAGCRAVRGLDPPDPRPRLLRRGPAFAAMVGERPGAAASMDRRRPTRPRPSPPATSWSAPSGAFRWTSGRSSSCTTTSGCPWSRSPRSSSIPAGTARSRLHYATQGLRAVLIGDAELELQKGRLGMTDDRSLERAARSWLESGPTEAPDPRRRRCPPSHPDHTPGPGDSRSCGGCPR